MSLRSLIAGVCIFLNFGAFASVSSVVVNPSTVSGIDSSNPQDIVLFGGLSGYIGDCTAPHAINTCNACSALNPRLGVYQCAQRSIHPHLALTITMSFDAVPQNARLVVQWNDSNGSMIPITRPLTFAPNQPFTVQIPWSEICFQAGMGSNCMASSGSSGHLIVGLSDGSSHLTAGSYQKFTVKISSVNPFDSGSLISPTSTPTPEMPFTDFRVKASDSKVLVTDIYRGSTGPVRIPSLRWEALRVYYAPTVNHQPDFFQMDLASSKYVDLSVSDKSQVATTLNDNKVPGLKNGTTYMFLIGSVDEASIVSGLMDPASLNALTPDQQSGYIATPMKHPSLQ